MKLFGHMLALACLLGVAPLCYAEMENTSTLMQDAQKETRDLLQTIGSYTVDKKNAAVQEVNESLNKMDNYIDVLEAKIDKDWDKMSEAMRKQTRENLRALRKQRNEVAQWYGRMKSSSTDAWDHTKKGFSEAYKDLGNTWKTAKDRFTSEE
ncbi:MAG: hypothetical protein CSA09_05405 [Candidatus Contendobacter odensis]|uniref:Uncharacterized protein n=1 Tax=Candidatus Contendibacter odensensis TaxID=1400860 RepID=A0A2G6PDW6_9GAMM|nr:MAG: hypothetical protein CSA09_05405 [Candidatus Contendobacter odensis]